jgi:hypothetical protein
MEAYGLDVAVPPGPALDVDERLPDSLRFGVNLDVSIIVFLLEIQAPRWPGSASASGRMMGSPLFAAAAAGSRAGR